jgi:hypothetical protein
MPTQACAQCPYTRPVHTVPMLVQYPLSIVSPVHIVPTSVQCIWPLRQSSAYGPYVSLVHMPLRQSSAYGPYVSPVHMPICPYSSPSSSLHHLTTYQGAFRHRCSPSIRQYSSHDSHILDNSSTVHWLVLGTHLSTRV